MAKSNAALAAAPETEIADAETAVDYPADPAYEDEVDPNKAVVVLTWEGEKFTLPKRRGRWPSDAGLCFENERVQSAIKILIGDEAYARLDAVCPFLDDMEAFANYASKVITRECVA